MQRKVAAARVGQKKSVKTYEDLSRKWPFVADWSGVNDLGLRLGEKVNNARKWVVTGDHPLDELKWGTFAAPEQLTGKNIDEYQVQIHPTVVLVGEHLFDNIKERRDFDLMGVKPLEDGSILVTYKPAKA